MVKKKLFKRILPFFQDLLTSDFEIGHYIFDRIIPRAVFFFTGKFVSIFQVGIQILENSLLINQEVAIGEATVVTEKIF